MSFEIPEGLLCTKTHECVYQQDGTYFITITDFAVEQLGDVVFVELPEAGTEFAAEEVFGTIESVKAASELYAPVGFKVLEVNDGLVAQPELLNKDPYADGWLLKVELTDVSELDTLLEYDDYKTEVH
ncbi:MAG: glycine cleavage system protein GcvH [Candidatus Gastranaerophilales bacterium]|nr:glycine cleavage system protein GcvH [Candidatus Gastranaerophilales bacterium]